MKEKRQVLAQRMAEGIKQRKPPAGMAEGIKHRNPPAGKAEGFHEKTAATYSPTGVQYHRRSTGLTSLFGMGRGGTPQQ